MKSVSVLLVGLGRVGSRFYDKFHAVGKERLRIVGVCERDATNPYVAKAQKDGIPVYADHREAVRSLGSTVDIILDTTNVPAVKQDLRALLQETSNHHTVLLPLVVSYLMWYLSDQTEEMVQNHVDPGY